MTEAIRAGYVWAPGAQIRIDPDVAGAEFERLEREAHGQGVAVDAVRSAATDPRSPLWAHFTHDVDAAVDKCHTSEAYELLRSIRYRLVNPVTEDERPGPRVYQPVRVVMDDRSRPGVYLRVAYTPPASPPPAPEPIRMVVRQAPPRVEAPAQPALMLPEPAPEPAATPAPEPGMVVLTPSRERMRAMLLRLAETLDGDEYFAGVVAAIRALP